MTCIEKFTFSRHFAALPGALCEDREAAAPAPALVHSDDDLARARSEAHAAGHDEGHAAGLADGRAEALASARTAREQRELELLARLAEHLEQAVGERDAIARTAERSALALALTALRKSLPALHRHHAAVEIEAMVRELPQLSGETTTLCVAVHPELADALAQKLSSTIAGPSLATRLTVAADPELAPGDCRIAWSGGGAERRLSALMTRIDDIVGTVAGERPRDADAERFRSTESHG